MLKKLRTFSYIVITSLTFFSFIFYEYTKITGKIQFLEKRIEDLEREVEDIKKKIKHLERE